MNLREELFNNRDLKYRDFHKKLVPNVDESKIIGVRVPIVRKIAKSAFQNNAENLCEYYEEKEVFGLTISMKNALPRSIKRIYPSLSALLTIGQYATFAQHLLNLSQRTRLSILTFSHHCRSRGISYKICNSCSYGFYLDDEYIDRVLDLYKTILSEKYYVNMALAWAYSTAFVKYEEK